MKLSELRPCDACGGELPPVFATIKAARYLVAPQAVNQVMSLRQMFGGNLLLAEAMSPVDSVTDRLDEKELVLCQSCFIDRLGTLFFDEEAGTVEGEPDDAP